MAELLKSIWNFDICMCSTMRTSCYETSWTVLCTAFLMYSFTIYFLKPASWRPMKYT